MLFWEMYSSLPKQANYQCMYSVMSWHRSSWKPTAVFPEENISAGSSTLSSDPLHFWRGAMVNSEMRTALLVIREGKQQRRAIDSSSHVFLSPQHVLMCIFFCIHVGMWASFHVRKLWKPSVKFHIWVASIKMVNFKMNLRLNTEASFNLRTWKKVLIKCRILLSKEAKAQNGINWHP